MREIESETEKDTQRYTKRDRDKRSRKSGRE